AGGAHLAALGQSASALRQNVGSLLGLEFFVHREVRAFNNGGPMLRAGACNSSKPSTSKPTNANLHQNPVLSIRSNASDFGPRRSKRSQPDPIFTGDQRGGSTVHRHSGKNVRSRFGPWLPRL